MLDVSSPPEVTSEFRRVLADRGARLTLAVPVYMAHPAPTFQWRLNGVEIPGATDERLLIDRLDDGDAGTYTCLLANIAGSATWEEVLVEVRN